MNGQHRAIAVFGAYGHTAAFVVAELRRRGREPLLVGRDAARPHAAAQAHPGARARVASAADPASLDRALSGAAAVVNCAGPFAGTALPVADAALRAGIPYLDVAAEQAVTVEMFQRRTRQARDAGVVVAPSMAFYGGLGDLLASAAMGDWPVADDITIAIALDSWRPPAWRGDQLRAAVAEGGAAGDAPEVDDEGGGLVGGDPQGVRASWTGVRGSLSQTPHLARFRRIRNEGLASFLWGGPVRGQSHRAGSSAVAEHPSRRRTGSTGMAFAWASLR
ncbi:saccharopine dehydrogenase NADP-binding domain-containing protein [Streptosporangium sp. V21-05]|uniref:saccharopine dehydrogenase NADP-binding domain-containing protein n=1 Tax=Streptosporangium sp. V21-05 TaxID=3446115 RepID=UPI003F53D033